MMDLSELRRANRARQAEWCPDQEPDLSYRGNELAGESGEACNVIKKLERERHGWRGSRATTAQLAAELADVVICADLIAMQEDIDLSQAVIDKFNLTSRENDLTTLLHHPLAIVAQPDAMPDPTLMIDYGNGQLGMAMFHYAGEGADFRQIAREHGFQIRVLHLESDPDAGELAERYADGDDISLEDWRPIPPNGWRLAAKNDTEDGVVACFIRWIRVTGDDGGAP